MVSNFAGLILLTVVVATSIALLHKLLDCVAFLLGSVEGVRELDHDLVVGDPACSAACVVGAVICCVLLVHGRCLMYAEAGGCALCALDAGGYAPRAALYARVRGG